MKFAQFQSTYKENPLQVLEKTGEVLENKYYRNREQASLFRQAMSNSKVEDRNINILAKATTDVENILGEVKGQWQYASNALYKAKDRLTNDKALAAATEDYQKRAQAQTELQDRYEKGDVTDEQMTAYGIYNKYLNTKSISVDENGTIKNRWSVLAPPKKPDIDAQVTKMVDILLKNPDSVDSGLRTILNKNGINTGYLERVRTEQVRPDKIFNMVKGYLATTPDVKQYYQYINNADLLAKTNDIDETGNVTTKSILPHLVSEYRNMGWNVDDAGRLLDNYQHYINGQGTFDFVKDKNGKKVEIKNAPTSLLDSADVKYYVNEGKLSVEDALKQTFLNHKLDGQLNAVASDYSKFGFSKVASIDTMKDEEYWLKAKLDLEKKTTAALYTMTPDPAPMFSSDYSIRDAQALSDQLKSRVQTPEVIQQIRDQTNNIRTLSKSYASTPEGNAFIDHLWNDATKILPLDKKDFVDKTYKQAFTDYLLGNGSMPDDIVKIFNVGGIPNSDNASTVLMPNASAIGTNIGKILAGSPTHFEQNKIQFQKEIDKKLKDGLSINNNYQVFRGQDGKESPFHTQQGEYIKSHGDSWILPGNLNKQGEPIKLQDYIPQMIKEAKLQGHGYSPEEWDVRYYPNDNTSTGFGTGVIKFTTNSKFPNTLKAPIIPPIVVRPDASVKNEALFENSKFIYDNASSPEVQNFALEGLVMSQYGDTFAPLLNNIALGTQISGQDESRDSRLVNNVSFGGRNFTMELKPTTIPGQGVNYDLYITPESARLNGVTSDISKPVASGKSIPDMIKSLYIQNTSISSK